MKFLSRLFGTKETAAAPSLSREESGKRVAAQYRMRMVDEMTDIEMRSRQAGKLAEMAALRDQILCSLTDSVINSLSRDFQLSISDVASYLVMNPISSENGDPFAKFRDPGHLLENADEARFTLCFQVLLRLDIGAMVPRPTLDELQGTSKKLWDADPQRVGAQATYWWLEGLSRTSAQSAALTEKDIALLASVGFVEQCRTATSREQWMILMEKALAEAIRAKPVQGADVLHVRLAHTLGPLGKLRS